MLIVILLTLCSCFSTRYNKYMEMISKGVLQPEKMPPTERSAYYHGLRAHYQIVVWKLLNNDEVTLNPSNWGWTVENNKMISIVNDIEIAPSCILKVIRCHCKPSSNQCGSNRCSCKRNGINCAPICGQCRGEECLNKEVCRVLMDILLRFIWVFTAL